MKHCPLVAIFILVLSASAAWPAGGNLVTNGGFEDLSTGGKPAGWSFEGAGRMARGAGALIRKAHSGKAALGVGSSFELVDYFAHSDAFELGEARELFVTCYYQTKRAPRATVALATFRELPTEGFLGTPPIQFDSRPLPDTKQWRLGAARFRLSPAAQYGVLLFRIGGEGVLAADDVSVVPHPGTVEAELLIPGLVDALPARRLARLRVRNSGAFEVRGIAELTATPKRGKPRVHSTPFELAPSAETLLDISYSFDAEQSHQVTITLFDSARERVFSHIGFDAPALVDVQTIVPAFRSSILSTLQPETCRFRCSIKAFQPLVDQIELTGVLRASTGDRAERSARVSEGSDVGEWELRVPAANLAPGRYELVVTATTGGRRLTSSTPLWVPEPRRWEIGHDQHGVLQISGRPLFPIGVLGVEAEVALKDLAASGFNCVVAPGGAIRIEFLDEAHLRGLKVALMLEPRHGGGLAGGVQQLAMHPALLAWYVPGVPGSSAVDARAAAESRRRIATLDPYHPVIGLLPDDSPCALQRIGADVMVAASRPVTYWPLTTLAEQLEAARRDGLGAQPLWAAVQTDGLAWRLGQGMSRSGDGREPTPGELRCMVYLAIIHGARGILYTAYHMPARRGVPALFLPRDCPELWTAVTETNEELLALSPSLLSPLAPRQLAAQPSEVHAALVGDGPRQVLIAVNPTARPLDARIHLPSTATGSIRPFAPDDPTPDLDGQTLRISLPAHTVRLFRAP